MCLDPGWVRAFQICTDAPLWRGPDVFPWSQLHSSPSLLTAALRPQSCHVHCSCGWVVYDRRALRPLHAWESREIGVVATVLSTLKNLRQPHFIRSFLRLVASSEMQQGKACSVNNCRLRPRKWLSPESACISMRAHVPSTHMEYCGACLSHQSWGAEAGGFCGVSG